MGPYKLRCSLTGHDKDVRALCTTEEPSSSIVSGSRDVTARVWSPNETDNGFTEGNILSGHSGFVAAVCVLPASADHPRGLIATGSNDNMIHIYDFESPAPIYRLAGHEDTVCCLSSGKFGTLMSGSWDKTAKVWLEDKNLLTLSGHELAVWCVLVMPENGYMVTGAADKLIKVWKAGKCEHTLRGHSDCVRGLAVVNGQDFLSCSNDASIRRWSVTGTVLQVYYSHMNYIYNLAMIPNTSDFVSVSEDRSLKIWKNGECVQTVTHPTTSVWCVCVLQNGDIATGSSDGVIRVFTASDDRTASHGDINAFAEQVSASHIPTQVGDIDSEKLPGPEVLLAPGKKDGAVQMVKIGSNVEAHQWSSSDQIWSKVGDVVGSSGGSSKSRELHEGKEYDFVFTVDIAEGKPSLKLPYNMAEDPWLAAQKFISKHGLNQAYLEQVRDFIVENSQSLSMSQQSAGTTYQDPFTGGSSYVPGSAPMDTSSGGGYADPFTGEGRYVPPSASNGHTSNSVPSQGVDPFTGGGSYRPAEAMSRPSVNPYFPLSAVQTFNNIKPDAAIKKLKELNKQIPGSMQCIESDLDIMAELCNIEKPPTAPMLAYIWRLLQWPKEQVFPGLDIMRVALRNPTVNEHFCNSSKGPEFLGLLVKFLDSEQTTINQTLALRAIANLTSHQNGQDLILANCENIIPLISTMFTNAKANLQIAASTILMDLAVLLKRTDDVEGKSQLLSALTCSAETVVDSEAKFRLCVALGTLIWKDDDSAAMAKSLGAEAVVDKWKQSSDLSKLEECAKYVGELL